MPKIELPFLDLTAPGFSTRSAQVLKARAQHWCARTPHGIAVLRHRQAGLLLRDRRLRQGSHAWPETVGISGTFADFWRRSVISLEGPPHKDMRRIAQTALAEDHIRALVPQFTASAETLCARLANTGPFDLVDRFTEPFAGLAIAALLDRPPADASTIASDATTLGFAMGLQARDHETEINAACDRLLTMAESMLDGAPDASFVGRLRNAGHADRQSLIDLIVIAIFGGVDTTRAQLSFAGWLFANHPDQWRWLRANTKAIPEAIDEVIRTRPTTTWATREALDDIVFEDIVIRRGETVHVLVHATATDPLTDHSGTFDITARRKPHFGFGGGAHHCLGHFVARTDMAAALAVWLRHWERIDLVGTPEFLPDSGNTSPVTLRVQPVWDPSTTP